MKKGTKRKAGRKGGAAKSNVVMNDASQTVEENNHQEPEPEAKATESQSGTNDKPVAAEEESKKADAASNPVEKETKKKDESKRPAKRARVAKPQEEPEYFEEKRNLEDLWKEMIPIGTEWEQIDLVYRYNWSFKNLEEALEEGGVLYGKKVYLFECTEPQFIPVQGAHKLVVIPVVVAAASPFPPSDQIGIASVQRESEDIVPMKKMKMDWIPYIPLENRGRQVERLKNQKHETQIFILGCTQRRAGLKQLNEDRVKKFQYCLPYFYNPFKEDEEVDKTDVSIMYPTEPPIVCEFDWELDDLEEFTDKLIEEDQLPADQKEEFKKFVKEKVREVRKAQREAKEARKKALEEMSEEKKTAIQSMRFYKFYPVSTSDTPDVSSVKAPYINRYYGRANEVL
ncbi:OLC1v1009061C1 [Oldenlandia corymbosa var. corymbosa]|uniref:OLC1v1009061C1 n=1 Tax=Oldenlandia corymbosa var. corymbosa TaxID=529605 RepID=A0AAV1DNB3_OLDCO|nr:OLC1v1009061C1 [Oldenlandia corymbosa var. corymbosa]